MESLSVIWIIGIIFAFILDTITMLIIGKIINGIAIEWHLLRFPYISTKSFLCKTEVGFYQYLYLVVLWEICSFMLSV